MGGFVRKTIGSLTGSDRAGEKAMEASQISADAQREALAYLKEREALPQQFREAALTQMGGLYGLEGGEGSQQMLIEQAQRSPLYEAMMGTRQAGEDAILRNAAATGGLRSGNVQGALYDYNTQLQNQALLESYSQQLQGLTGMAQLPSNAGQIAGAMGGIGNTLAQGQVAAGQAQQAGMGGLISGGLGALGGFWAGGGKLF